MAERVGFEPTKGYKPLLVFKTSAFNRSATSPTYRGAFCLHSGADSTCVAIICEIRPRFGRFDD